MSEEVLLPCPFCGEPAERKRRYYKPTTAGQRETHNLAWMDWTGCWNSKCFKPQVYSSIKGEANRIWNQRTVTHE